MEHVLFILRDGKIQAIRTTSGDIKVHVIDYDKIKDGNDVSLDWPARTITVQQMNGFIGESRAEYPNLTGDRQIESDNSENSGLLDAVRMYLEYNKEYLRDFPVLLRPVTEKMKQAVGEKRF